MKVQYANNINDSKSVNKIFRLWNGAVICCIRDRQVRYHMSHLRQRKSNILYHISQKNQALQLKV